jgi:hypothetical protein
MWHAQQLHAQEPGVVALITAGDIPGENKVKGGASDSALLASERVEYVGQPLALLVATAPRLAEEAAARVAVEYGHPKARCSCSLRPRLPRMGGIGGIIFLLFSFTPAEWRVCLPCILLVASPCPVVLQAGLPWQPAGT